MKYLEPENNTFDAVVIDITHRCNMECANCYIPNREVPDLNMDKAYDVLERIPNRIFVRIIGAEPTMREDLFEIITRIKQMGHRTSLTTNGLKLARPEYVKALKDAGLRYVLISMNGSLDNSVYKILDNGKYATVKHRALVNALENNMVVNTGTIIAKGVNEHNIKEQVELINNYAYKYNPKVPMVVRLKTVGTIGRNMGAESAYTFEEFKDLVFSELGLDKEEVMANLKTAHNHAGNMLFQYDKIMVRLIDWSVDDEGVPDSGNEQRGRLTQDFKIAPFFEHVKENEYGY